MRQVYSNIKRMDKQAGDILAELDAEGLLDSTIVFWYSDHGGPLPRQKRLLYDSGMRVPMIVRFPNKWRAGEVDDQLISFIDLKPTILSLAGIDPPDYIQGQAFLGEYQAEQPRSYVHGAGDRFDEIPDMIRAVRDHQYKYLRNFHPEKQYYLPVSYREQMPIMQELLRMRDEGELNEYQAQWFRNTKDKEELFDTINDPHELHNLASDPDYAEKLQELSTEMDLWMATIEDKGTMSEKEYLMSIWPEGKQPVTAAPVANKVRNEVTLTTVTEGASIGYQIVSEKSPESDVWMIYTAPVQLKREERLIAVAHRIGFSQSETIEVK